MEGAAGLVEVVVVPCAGGEGEEFGGDPGAEAVEGVGVVVFEAGAVFERSEGRLDVVADGGEVWLMISPPRRPSDGSLSATSRSFRSAGHEDGRSGRAVRGGGAFGPA